MVDKINRRGSIKAVAGAFAATAVASSFPAPAIASGVREWVMVSTFPKGSPGLQQSGANVAKNIEELSGGRIKVKAFGAGELVPAMETFDAVRENKAQLGNSMPYFWTGKDKLASFFSAAPGGLTAEEQAAWLYHGGGQELWDEVYAQYNLKGLMTGAFGSQQAGWFNKEINSLDDLQGLKIRIPGLAGEVLGRLGASPTMLPLGEVIGALQAGTIDAAEFIGGWVDLAFGFPKVAKYFYGPGFHEPGSTEELLVNLDEWNDLEDDLKAVVEHACRSEYAQHSALFTYHQPMALKKIVEEYGVQVKPFPDEVMEAIFKTSNELMLEIGDSSDLSRRIYKSWDAYRQARIQFGDNQTLGLLKWRSKVALNS
jgi:TRAP-type mannitol/chloroaromatic compound transport system substrate-binding protein